MDYRDILIFYPDGHEEKTHCDISDLRYKPFILIKHHYPISEIADLAKKNENEIRKINNLISKYRRNIDAFLDRQLKGDVIDYDIDVSGVLEELLKYLTGMDFEEGLSEIKRKSAIKFANIREKYVDRMDDYFALFGDVKDMDTIAFKIFQFYWELPLKRDELRKLVKTDLGEEVREKYIFIGKPANEKIVMPILDRIEETREIPEPGTDDYSVLINEFGENFEYDWRQIGDEYFTQLSFQPYYIQPHSTVFYVQRLIEMLMKIPVNYQYLWANAQLSSNFDRQKAYFDRIFKDLYDYSAGGVPKANLYRFFVDILGYSEAELDDVYKMSKVDAVEEVNLGVLSRDDMMRKKPFNTILLGYFEYQSLSQNMVWEKKYRVGTYPNSNPYFAFDDEIARLAYEKMLEQPEKLAYGNSSQNRTLESFGELERNEIHFVSMTDYKDFLLNEFQNPEDIEGIVENTIQRYFYNVKTMEQVLVGQEYKPKNVNEMANLVRNTTIFQYIENFDLELPEELKYSIVGKNTVEIKFQYESLFKDFYSPNLRDIMNEIPLDDEFIPFVRYYDEQRSENIFRVYKESFTNDRQDRIAKNTYENWINMETFALNMGKLTKTNEPKKCLSFKVRLCNQIISYSDPEPILKAKQHTKTYTDYTQQFNPKQVRKFIVSYSQGGNMEHFVEEYLFTPDKRAIYKHRTIFMDIYLFASDGSMKFKIVFDPEGYFHSQYMDSIYNAVNNFNGMLNELPQCMGRLDYQYLCNVMNRPNEYFLSTTLNMSSIVQYQYTTNKDTTNFIINPVYFRDIVSRLPVYFTIVEPVFTKNMKLEFYMNGKWLKGATIKEYDQTTGTYTIYYKKSEIPGIRGSNLKSEGEQTKALFLNFRYKRVSNYKQEGPLIELYRKYKSWGLNQLQIKEKIQQEFDISDEEIDAMEKRIDDISKDIRVSDDKRVDANGIDIKLYYSPQESAQKTYNIELDHYKSLDDFKTVVFLLDVLFKMYYHEYVVGSNRAIEMTDLEDKEEMDRALEIQEDEIDIDLDLFEQQFNEDMEAEEEEDEEQAVGVVEQPKKQQLLKENILEFNYEMMGTSSNLFLENLYSIDQKQFKWESKDEKKKYTIACQGTKRYPKVLSVEKVANLNEDFPALDVEGSIPTGNKLSFKAGLGLTYLGNKEGIAKSEADVKEEYCRPGEEIDENKRCVSIQYGSQKDQASWQNIFMCPKIWCIVDRIPLHPRHLKDGSNENCDRFISKADITPEQAKSEYGSMKAFEKLEYRLWRICRSCGKDILEHKIKCPKCGRGVLEPTNTNNIPTKTTSLYVLPNEEIKKKNYIYPGFIKNSKHPLAIPSVCCFNNPNTRLAEKFNITAKRVHNVNAGRYIQTFGKMLDRGRIGQVPKVFAGFLNLSNEYFNSATLICNKGNEQRFYRFGIEQNNNNVLDCVRAILLSNDIFKTNPRVLDDLLLKNITEEILARIPMLSFALRDIGPNQISPLQNFMEYLMSAGYKYDFSLFQFLNQDMSWMGLGGNTDLDKDDLRVGLNIFILSMNNEGKLLVEVPKGYIQPYQLDKPRGKCVLLFKKNKTLDVDSENSCEIDNKRLPLYEPIFAVRFKCAEKEGGRDEYYQKVFELEHPVIRKVLSLIDKTTLTKPAELLITKDKKPMNQYTVDWLKERGVSIERLVLDSSNLVIGAIANGIFIPLYPSNFAPQLNYGTIKYLDYLDDSSLSDYSDLVVKLQKMVETEDFSWLRPVRVIQNNLGQYNGFMLENNVIIPFKPEPEINNLELPVEVLDYKSIEEILSTHSFQIKYSQKITFEELLRENFSVADMKPKVRDNYLVGVYLTNKEKNINNLYIPLENELYNADIHGKQQTVATTKRDFKDIVENYQNLYQQTLGRIRSRPVGFRINENTKDIILIYLETNDMIPVTKSSTNNRLGVRNEKGKYVAHLIQEVELDYLMNSMAVYDWNRYDMTVSNGDSRVHFIQALNYKRNSYQRFRFEIAQILNRETKTATKRKDKIMVEGEETSKLSYKERIKKILETPQSNNKKRSQVLEIIELLVKMYMNVQDITDDEKNRLQSTTILESCLDHNKDTCNRDPFCNWRPFGETKEEFLKKAITAKPPKKSEIVEFLALFDIQPTGDLEEDKRVYFEKKYEYKQLGSIFENYKKKDVRAKIDKELELNGYVISESAIDNVKTYVKLIEQGQCRFKLDRLGADDIKRIEFVRKIVEELVRNNIKRNEIMNNKIRLVETKLSYHVYGGEFMFTQAELKSKQHLSIYCKELNNRLKILDFFTRNSSLYEYEVPDLPELVLKEKLEQYGLKAESQYLNYKFVGDDFFYVPEVSVARMIKNLDKGETNRLLLNILQLNTNLEVCRITSKQEDVDFRIV